MAYVLECNSTVVSVVWTISDHVFLVPKLVSILSRAKTRNSVAIVSTVTGSIKMNGIVSGPWFFAEGVLLEVEVSPCSFWKL